MSIALLLAYTLRITIPSIWLSPLIVNYAGFIILIVAVLTLFFSSRFSFFYPALVLVILLAITTLVSNAFETASGRFVLWFLVFCAVAPLIRSYKADLFRYYLWQNHILIIYVITVLSFIWYMLKLPLYGKGMSGVTMHCMLLAAIAGMSSVLSFSKILFNKKSVLYWGIFIVSILTCLLGASRVAFIAAVIGCAVATCMQLKSAKNALFSIGILLIMAIVVGVLIDDGQNSSNSLKKNQFTSEILEKGEANSREQLWANRVQEFSENVITGVGIGVDTFKMKSSEISAEVVEPGSSYLAVLSMTGLLGAFGLILLFFNLGYRLLKNTALTPKQDLTECVAIGVFWLAHAIAEGWIFAGGALLCLFFWIWVGRLAYLGTKIRRNTRRAFP